MAGAELIGVGVELTSATTANLVVGTSTITSGADGRVLYDNNGVVGEKAVTGTGDVVLASSPTVDALTLTDVLSMTGMAFADLPASPAAGQIAYITDGDTTTWGDTVAGSGSDKVLVWFNGTNWTVIGA